MIWVDHLADAVKKFDLSRNHAPLARGQKVAQVGFAGVKEHHLKLYLRIAHIDAVGAAFLAGGTVQPHLDLHLHGAGGYDIADRGLAATIHPRMGQ